MNCGGTRQSLAAQSHDRGGVDEIHVQSALKPIRAMDFDDLPRVHVVRCHDRLDIENVEGGNYSAG